MQMINHVKDLRYGNGNHLKISIGKKLNVKIGIHNGKVIVGVIGYHKP